MTLEKKDTLMCGTRFPREAVDTVPREVFIRQSVNDSGDGFLLDLTRAPGGMIMPD